MFFLFDCLLLIIHYYLPSVLLILLILSLSYYSLLLGATVSGSGGQRAERWLFLLVRDGQQCCVSSSWIQTEHWIHTSHCVSTSKHSTHGNDGIIQLQLADAAIQTFDVQKCFEVSINEYTDPKKVHKSYQVRINSR